MRFGGIWSSRKVSQSEVGEDTQSAGPRTSSRCWKSARKTLDLYSSQVFQDLLLLAVQPACEGHREQVERGPGRSHGPRRLHDKRFAGLGLQVVLICARHGDGLG